MSQTEKVIESLMEQIETLKNTVKKLSDEEKKRKKKRFYNFIFYAFLLCILTLKFKWDINNYLNPNLFL